MQQYIDLCNQVIEKGTVKSDRTGTGTISLVGPQMRFDLRDGFPLMTTKKMGIKTILVELFFFLRGETNNKWLNERGVTIWDEWALGDEYSEPGALGPIYGSAWARWPDYKKLDSSELDKYISKGYRVIGGSYDGKYIVQGHIDQIAYVKEHLAKKSNSRRLIVTAWNPALLPEEGVEHATNVLNGKQVLPPCHSPFQLITEPLTLEELYRENKIGSQEVHDIEQILSNEQCKDPLARAIELLQVKRPHLKTHYLNMILSIRSNDLPLGAPFNIASYALLMEFLSHKYGYVAKELVYNVGDAHIYLNQIDILKEQLSRKPLDLPRLELTEKARNFMDFSEYNPKSDDLSELMTLVGYKSHPAIRFPDPAV